ncbi:hypothetical protein F4818DRAFT_442483 [Hypoxylon cercidicola]|nr:hypothetical protein F4818DRAFT_442483 [Hypoxylon cercidicola]
MKVKNTLLAIFIAFFIEVILVSSRVLDTKDLATNINNIGLVIRGKPGRQGGSGSGSNSSKKKKSTLKAGDESKADGELAEWGLRRDGGESSNDAPMPYHFNDQENDYVAKFGETQWQSAIISPDQGHTQQYGADPVYKYFTNVEHQAFHTEAVFTTELTDGQSRNLPVNRRALTINSWIEANGDPANLRTVSDENIQNPGARQAFEDVFKAKKGVEISDESVDQFVQMKVSDEDWSKWDNGNNPFPRGYEAMSIDYPSMQSRVAGVTLSIDDGGWYHAIHDLEAVPDLESKLRIRAEYFKRWAMTDRLTNPLFEVDE